MDITELEPQIKQLIKSNLVSTGLLVYQIEEVMEHLYQDLMDLMDAHELRGLK